MTEPNADTLIQLVNLEFRSRLALRGFSRPEIIVIRAAYEDAKECALSAWLGAPDDDGRKEVKSKMKFVTRILLVEPPSATHIEIVTVEGTNAKVIGVENFSSGNVGLIVTAEDSETPGEVTSIEVRLLKLESATPNDPFRADVPDGFEVFGVVQFDSGVIRAVCVPAPIEAVQSLGGVVERSIIDA